MLPPTPLKRTPLHSLHLALGAKDGALRRLRDAGANPSGILNEHLHTRSKAGLFYVWHMGQLRLAGADPVNALNAREPAEERQSSFLRNGGERQR